MTFLGPVVRLELTVHGRPFWVDIPHARSAGLVRKKPLTVLFDPADRVVIPSARAGGARP